MVYGFSNNHYLNQIPIQYYHWMDYWYDHFKKQWNNDYHYDMSMIYHSKSKAIGKWYQNISIHGLYLIELTPSLLIIRELVPLLMYFGMTYSQMLFIGRKTDNIPLIRNIASCIGQHYYCHSWYNGLISNWTVTYYTKNHLMINNIYYAPFWGIRYLNYIPDIIVYCDSEVTYHSIQEVFAKKIPSIGITPHIDDHYAITYPILGNSNNILFGQWMLLLLFFAYRFGMISRYIRYYI